MSAQELVSLFADPKIVGSDPAPLLADAELGPLTKKTFLLSSFIASFNLKYKVNIFSYILMRPYLPLGDCNGLRNKLVCFVLSKFFWGKQKKKSFLSQHVSLSKKPLK